MVRINFTDSAFLSQIDQAPLRIRHHDDVSVYQPLDTYDEAYPFKLVDNRSLRPPSFLLASAVSSSGQIALLDSLRSLPPGRVTDFILRYMQDTVLLGMMPSPFPSEPEGFDRALDRFFSKPTEQEFAMRDQSFPLIARHRVDPLNFAAVEAVDHIPLSFEGRIQALIRELTAFDLVLTDRTWFGDPAVLRSRLFEITFYREPHEPADIGKVLDEFFHYGLISEKDYKSGKTLLERLPPLTSPEWIEESRQWAVDGSTLLTINPELTKAFRPESRRVDSPPFQLSLLPFSKYIRDKKRELAHQASLLYYDTCLQVDPNLIDEESHDGALPPELKWAPIPPEFTTYDERDFYSFVLTDASRLPEEYREFARHLTEEVWQLRDQARSQEATELFGNPFFALLALADVNPSSSPSGGQEEPKREPVVLQNEANYLKPNPSKGYLSGILNEKALHLYREEVEPAIQKDYLFSLPFRHQAVAFIEQVFNEYSWYELMVVAGFTELENLPDDDLWQNLDQTFVEFDRDLYNAAGKLFLYIIDGKIETKRDRLKDALESLQSLARERARLKEAGAETAGYPLAALLDQLIRERLEPVYEYLKHEREAAFDDAKMSPYFDESIIRKGEEDYDLVLGIFEEALGLSDPETGVLLQALSRSASLIKNVLSAADRTLAIPKLSETAFSDWIQSEASAYRSLLRSSSRKEQESRDHDFFPPEISVTETVKLFIEGKRTAQDLTRFLGEHFHGRFSILKPLTDVWSDHLERLEDEVLDYVRPEEAENFINRVRFFIYYAHVQYRKEEVEKERRATSVDQVVQIIESDFRQWVDYLTSGWPTEIGFSRKYGQIDETFLPNHHTYLSPEDFLSYLKGEASEKDNAEGIALDTYTIIHRLSRFLIDPENGYYRYFSYMGWTADEYDQPLQAVNDHDNLNRLVLVLDDMSRQAEYCLKENLSPEEALRLKQIKEISDQVSFNVRRFLDDPPIYREWVVRKEGKIRAIIPHKILSPSSDYLLTPSSSPLLEARSFLFEAERLPLVSFEEPVSGYKLSELFPDNPFETNLKEHEEALQGIPSIAEEPYSEWLLRTVSPADTCYLLGRLAEKLAGPDDPVARLRLKYGAYGRPFDHLNLLLKSLKGIPFVDKMDQRQFEKDTSDMTPAQMLWFYGWVQLQMHATKLEREMGREYINYEYIKIREFDAFVDHLSYEEAIQIASDLVDKFNPETVSMDSLMNLDRQGVASFIQEVRRVYQQKESERSEAVKRKEIHFRLFGRRRDTFDHFSDYWLFYMAGRISREIYGYKTVNPGDWTLIWLGEDPDFDPAEVERSLQELPPEMQGALYEYILLKGIEDPEFKKQLLGYGVVPKSRFPEVPFTDDESFTVFNFLSDHADLWQREEDPLVWNVVVRDELDDPNLSRAAQFLKEFYLYDLNDRLEMYRFIEGEVFYSYGRYAVSALQLEADPSHRGPGLLGLNEGRAKDFVEEETTDQTIEWKEMEESTEMYTEVTEVPPRFWGWLDSLITRDHEAWNLLACESSQEEEEIYRRIILEIDQILDSDYGAGVGEEENLATFDRATSYVVQSVLHRVSQALQEGIDRGEKEYRNRVEILHAIEKILFEPFDVNHEGEIKLHSRYNPNAYSLDVPFELAFNWDAFSLMLQRKGLAAINRPILEIHLTNLLDTIPSFLRTGKIDFDFEKSRHPDEAEEHLQALMACLTHFDSLGQIAQGVAQQKTQEGYKSEIIEEAVSNRLSEVKDVLLRLLMEEIEEMRADEKKTVLVISAPLIDDIVLSLSMAKTLRDPLREDTRKELASRFRRLSVLCNIESNFTPPLRPDEEVGFIPLPDIVRAEFLEMADLSYELANLSPLMMRVVSEGVPADLGEHLDTLDLEDLKIALYFVGRILKIVQQAKETGMLKGDPGWKPNILAVRRLLESKIRKRIKFLEAS